MLHFPASELVLNPDGSIYHLNLHPEQIAPIIITVGDPGRVPEVSKYFDAIEHRVSKREFVTHTGRIGAQSLTVISTGIGPDNIDIVLNELDALVNIDLKNRSLKAIKTTLHIIRIGTSGSLHEEFELGDFVISAYGIGLDNLMHFYEWTPREDEAALQDALQIFLEESGALPVQPYLFGGDPQLIQALSPGMAAGITLTAPGFYAPQGRQLRGRSRLTASDIERLSNFSHRHLLLSNFEMETSAIYGLSRVLGHRAASCNVLLANRKKNEFHPEPQQAIQNLIEHVLEGISGISS
jgi:uridine phosphorylase